MKPIPSTAVKRQAVAAVRLPAAEATVQRGASMGALTVVAVPKVDRARALAAAKRIRELSEGRKPSKVHGGTKAIRELRDDGK